MTEGWDGDDAGRKFAKAVLFGFVPLALAAMGVFFWATAPSNGGGEVVADSPQPAVANPTDPVAADLPEAVADASGQGPTQGPPSAPSTRVAASSVSRQMPASEQPGSGPAVAEAPAQPEAGASAQPVEQQMASAEPMQGSTPTPEAGPATNPANPTAMPPAPSGTAANVLFGAAAGGFAIAAVVTAAKEGNGGSPFSP